MAQIINDQRTIILVQVLILMLDGDLVTPSSGCLVINYT